MKSGKQNSAGMQPGPDWRSVNPPEKGDFSTYQYNRINNLPEAHFPLFLHAQNGGIPRFE
jgi:hypothetical protein